MPNKEAVERSLSSWYDGKRIDEVQFCAVFLKEHPMIAVNGNLFSPEGRIPDETTVAKQIYDMIKGNPVSIL